MRTRYRVRHLTLLATLAAIAGCGPAAESSSDGPIVKGGDDRTGEYTAVEGWWKPAPDHDDVWGWGQVSAVAVDNPDRIIIGIWGDRDIRNRERVGSTNYLVVVDRDGNITENLDTVGLDLQQAPPGLHLAVRPGTARLGGGARPRHARREHADPQVHERRGRAGHAARRSRPPAGRRADARANPNPGPYTYGDPAVLAFLPNGRLPARRRLLELAHREVRRGRQLPHGVGRARRAAPGSSTSFTASPSTASGGSTWGIARTTGSRSSRKTGEFIEEWPDVSDPVGVFIDEHDAVWVISALC